MHQDISIVRQPNPKNMTVNLGDCINKLRLQVFDQLFILFFQPSFLSHQLSLHLFCFRDPLPIAFLVPFFLPLFHCPASLGLNLTKSRRLHLLSLYLSIIKNCLCLCLDLLQIRYFLRGCLDNVTRLISVTTQGINLFSAETTYKAGLFVTRLNAQRSPSQSLLLFDSSLYESIGVDHMLLFPRHYNPTCFI